MRFHSARDGPQLSQTFAGKNGKTSIFSGAKKIELHNSTFFGTTILFSKLFSRVNFIRGVTDLRYIDVNKDDHALSLTCQTVIGLLATIEAMEIQCEARAREGKPPLHYRI